MRSGLTLLAFDFDGTLAPICHDPADVRMSRGAAPLLQEMTQLAGVVVAVVSGRDAEDVTARIRASGAFVIGSHGLEIRGPGGAVVRDSPPLAAEIDPALRRAMQAAGLRIESKKHGVALHWRGMDRANVQAMIDSFRSWAHRVDLDVIDGRCVIEARCRGGSKEEALRWLAAATGASRVVYAGDDVTDFGALRFAAQNGRALFVASSERLPPPGVTVVDSFRELFRLVREEVMA
jgi:trehalose-phosphatase